MSLSLYTTLACLNNVDLDCKSDYKLQWFFVTLYIRCFNSVIVMVCYNSQNVGQVDSLGLGHGSPSVDKYNLRTSITTNTGATGGQRSALNYSSVNTGLEFPL